MALIGFVGIPRAVVCTIGIILAFFLICCSVIVIAMFAYSTNGASVSCDQYYVGAATCSARTSALGILSGCLGFTIGIFVAVFFGAAIFITILSSHAIISLISLSIIVFMCLTCAAGSIVGWALMADDIQSFHDAYNCSTPGGWSAAVAFAVIATVLWCVLAGVAVLWFCMRFCFEDTSETAGSPA